MPNTMILINSATVDAGGVSSVTFNNIPSTYTDLVIKCSTRSTVASNWSNFIITFNGTANNVNWSLKGLYGTGSISSSESQPKGIGQFSVGSTATTSTFSNIDIYIPNYTSANNKSLLIDTVTENNATAALPYLGASLWSNGSVISSITLTEGNSGSFVQYSNFCLYGIKNS